MKLSIYLIKDDIEDGIHRKSLWSAYSVQGGGVGCGPTKMQAVADIIKDYSKRYDIQYKITAIKFGYSFKYRRSNKNRHRYNKAIPWRTIRIGHIIAKVRIFKEIKWDK